ncbi:MAG: hypothetical protein LBE31_09320, partial [Deltaproteobacteria bacterium]|nr:hypothetical protein [Deltaproteobacteria bacterium]
MINRSFLVFKFLLWLWGAFFLITASPVTSLASDYLSFAPEEQIGTAPDGSPLEHSPLGTPSDSAPPGQPYWVVPPAQEEEIPYFLREPVPNGAPPLGTVPLGEAMFSPPPEPPKPTQKPKEKEETKPAPAQPTRATAPGEQVVELSYYMFKDDKGVIHLTDAPADPRYRLFTMQITVSSGLAPFRRLNIDKLRPLIMQAAGTYKVDPALI